MNEPIDIEAAKAALSAVFRVAEAVETMEKKSNVKSFFILYQAVRATSKTSVRNLPHMLQGMTATEKSMLYYWAKTEFDLRDDNLEDAIESAAGIYTALKRLREYFWRGKLKKG